MLRKWKSKNDNKLTHLGALFSFSFPLKYSITFFSQSGLTPFWAERQIYFSKAKLQYKITDHLGQVPSSRGPAHTRPDTPPPHSLHSLSKGQLTKKYLVLLDNEGIALNKPPPPKIESTTITAHYLLSLCVPSTPPGSTRTLRAEGTQSKDKLGG